MKLAVDVDGVLADQVTPVLERLSRKYGLNVRKNQIKRWDEPIADTDIKTEIEKSHLDKPFVLAMKPIHGAREAMRELARKHEITIATNRHPPSDDATRQWLRNNGIPFHHYVNTSVSGKEAVAGDVLIDDYPGNVLRFAKKGGIAILFEQPWNQNDPSVEEAVLKGRVIRARGRQSVLRILNSLGSSTHE